MTQEQILAMAETLLPGAGFFGGTEDFALELDVRAKVDRIVIAIDAGDPEILNIGSIQMRGADGEELDRRSLLRSAKLSTIYGSTSPQEVFDRVLDGRMVHSNREGRPTLTVELHEPAELSQVVVLNRNDIYGRRSRFLTLAAFCDGEPVFSYSNFGPGRLVAEFDDLLSALDISDGLADDLDNSTTFVEDIRESLLKRLQEGTFSWDVRKLAQLLPLFQEDAPVSDFQFTVCAAILLSLLGDRPHYNTHKLSCFQSVLGTEENVGRFIEEANRLKASRTGAQCNLVASKHAIHESMLINDRDKYISALDAIFRILNSFGIEAIVCYGTLLGAVREGGFLAHDDDVDVLYIDGSRSAAESAAKKHELIRRLQDEGLHVWGINENFHVTFQGASIDLFPSWQEGQRLNLLMERFQYRDIPASIIAPPSSVQLYDRTYPAPADPRAFLKERYGEGWTISDPYHEWPWKIKRAEPAT